MKNIQVIDGAENATYSLFEASDGEFEAIFPADGQDIEFIDDFVDRVGEQRAISVLNPLWERPIHKTKANGLHGTLYYGYEGRRKYFPDSKREIDRPSEQLNGAQRALYKQMQDARSDVKS